MNILITGGAGFIGSNLANTLASMLQPNKEDETEKPAKLGPAGREIEDTIQDGLSSKNILGKSGSSNNVKIIAVDDLSLGKPSNLSDKVKFVEGSVMNFDLLSDLTRGCDYIFHQAALSSSPMFLDDPRKGIDVNVMGFMNILECAKRNNVKKVIYASSSSLYNGHPMPFKETATITPKTFYESSFYCREIIAKTYSLEYKIPSVGLRYFSVYGPNEKHKGRFANTISQIIWDIAEKGKSPIIYGDGSQTRDFTFVEDIVQANILAMKQKNDENEEGCKIYNVGTGLQTSFNQVVDIINKSLGTDIKPTYVKNPINNYVQHTKADVSLIRSELGYEPRWKNVEHGINQDLKVSPCHSSSFATSPIAY